MVWKMGYGNVKESPSLKFNLLTSLSILSTLCVCMRARVCVCVLQFSCQVELVANALIKQTHGVNHIMTLRWLWGISLHQRVNPKWTLRKNSRWWFIILQKCVNMMEKCLFPSDISNILKKKVQCTVQS